MLNQKVEYLLSSILKQSSKEYFACPSCSSPHSCVVSRKYLVTALRRCRDCQLLFRTPTTSPNENEAFYQSKYAQGFTSDLPADAQLAEYLARQFVGTEKDYGKYIDVIKAAGGQPGQRLFDYGCSWGYGSWQLAQHGFQVEAFEISRPRAQFAQDKLGVVLHPAPPQEDSSFDIFFSAHVLEHVPSVNDAIALAMRLLKPHGLFIAFTPNGSAPFRKLEPQKWNKLWGMVHPSFLDDVFYRKAFQSKRHLIVSNPYPIEQIKAWSNAVDIESQSGSLGGDELLMLARA